MDLAHNEISSVEAANAIGAMLKTNTSLREFNLAGNELGNYEGKRKIINNLAYNYDLEKLSMLNRHDKELKALKEYYLGLNRAGRRLLRQEDVPNGMWAHVFAGVSSKPEFLYYFVQAKPDLFGPTVVKEQPAAKPVSRNIKITALSLNPFFDEEV